MWQVRRKSKSFRAADEQSLARRLADEAARSRPAADERLRLRIMRAVDDCRGRAAARPAPRAVRRWWPIWLGSIAATGAIAAAMLSVGPAARQPAVTPGMIAEQPAADQRAADGFAAAITAHDTLREAAAEVDGWAASPLGGESLLGIEQLAPLNHDAEVATQLVLSPLPMGESPSDTP